MRQLRLIALTTCGLLCAAALARAHDLAFRGPPPGGMPGGPPGAMMGGMYPGMGPVFPPSHPGHAGGGPPGPGVWGDAMEGHASDDAGPLWSVAAEAMNVRRSSARNQILVRDGAFVLAGTPLLTTAGLPFDYELAPRFTVVLHVNPEVDYQFSAFYIEDLTSEAVIVSDGSISVSAPNVLLDNFNAARFEYDSDFWSAELNARWRMMPRLTLLAGLRAMELTEGFVEADNFPGVTTFETVYTIAVRNRLCGGQVGALVSLLRMGPVCFDGLVKAGLFRNEAEHNMNDVLNIGLGQISAENTEGTSLWEIGLTLTWCVNANVKAWAGYNVLWLNGIATAPAQIPGNDLFGVSAVRLGPLGALGVNVDDYLRLDAFSGGIEVSF